MDSQEIDAALGDAEQAHAELVQLVQLSGPATALRKVEDFFRDPRVQMLAREVLGIATPFALSAAAGYAGPLGSLAVTVAAGAVTHELDALAVGRPPATLPTLALGPEWAPLERVQQDPTRLVGAGVVTTIGPDVFVADLAAFAGSYPEGSIERDALLTHEREHARRQIAAGPSWFVSYVRTSAFRWEEEQVGWKLELTKLVRAGRQIDPSIVAGFLAQGYMGMVDEPTALAWVRSVVAGAWA